MFVGALAPFSVCSIASSKLVRLALKPTVLTFAMLLAVTSSIVWWAFSPLIAENMLLIIFGAFPFRPRPPPRGSSRPGHSAVPLGDHRAVDVREHLLSHVLRVDRRDDGAVGDGDDERLVVDEDERGARALRREPADALREAGERGVVDDDAA